MGRAVWVSSTIVHRSTPSCHSFFKMHSLDIGPHSDPMGGWGACAGLGNTLNWPIDYVIIQGQVDGVEGYNEDQIAPIVLDLSNFTAQVPVILGTPMIGYIMNVIKEREIDTLATPWVNAHVASIQAVQWVTTTLESDKVTTRVLDLTEYDEVVTTKGCKMIDAFSSKIIHARMKTAFTGRRLNVMTHALHASEGPLPLGLMIQNAYTEITMAARMLPLWWETAWHTHRPWGRRSQWQELCLPTICLSHRYSLAW